MIEDFSPPPASNQAFQVREMQYLFRSGDNYTLMCKENYEQIEVPAGHLGNLAGFLKEGLDGIRCTVSDGRVIAIHLPDKVELELVQVEQGEIGSQIVLIGILETGARIELPKKVEIGSTIIVDTRFSKFAGVKRKSPHN